MSFFDKDGNQSANELVGYKALELVTKNVLGGEVFDSDSYHYGTSDGNTSALLGAKFRETKGARLLNFEKLLFRIDDDVEKLPIYGCNMVFGSGGKCHKINCQNRTAPLVFKFCTNDDKANVIARIPSTIKRGNEYVNIDFLFGIFLVGYSDEEDSSYHDIINVVFLPSVGWLTFNEITSRPDSNSVFQLIDVVTELIRKKEGPNG